MFDGSRRVLGALRDNDEKRSDSHSHTDGDYRPDHREAVLCAAGGVAVAAAVSFAAVRMFADGSVFSRALAVAGMLVWTAGFFNASVEDWKERHFDHRVLWALAGAGCLLVVASGGSLRQGAVWGAVATTVWVVERSLRVLAAKQPRKLFRSLRDQGDIDMAFLCVFPSAAVASGNWAAAQTMLYAMLAVSAVKLAELLAVALVKKRYLFGTAVHMGYAFALGGASVFVAISL